ncbi:MAG: YggS family pyridoxal phosphate-dependent enzyme [Anaerolineae bacterium]
MSDIQRALAYVRERIAEAALQTGRDPSSVTLIAVSKTFPPEDVMEAIAAGQLDFGENRVEEALPKMAAVSRLAEHGSQNADDTRQDAERAIPNTQYPIPNTPCAPQDAQSEIQNLKSKIRWHLIGHLQSRKVRDAAGHFCLIHSIDSVRLAETLDRRVANLAPDASHAQDILLECNVSGEETKNGFDLAGWEHDPDKLNRFADDVTRILSLTRLRVLGLMTMAPIVDHPDQARPYFASLRALRDALAERLPAAPLPHLSMGMTDDFEAAIAEGATLVRIGRAIFGARQT